MKPKQLPRILVIDDLYGKEENERFYFCQRLGIEETAARNIVENPVTEAVFCGGQMEKNGEVLNDLEGILEVIGKGWRQYPRWALILLDLHFNTGRDEDKIPGQYFGLTILKELYAIKEFRDIPVVILSAMERSQIEQLFADYGALDFVDKTDLNREMLNNLLLTHGLLKSEDAIGHSVPFLISLREARRRASAGNENILILGETGTGKELLARYIHRQSGRQGSFIPLFSQGVPETLIEDRLFGHVKGAFDGARTHQAGAAELADNGTLFIDEFGNIPSSIQERFLRLLDRNIREIQRIGSQEWKKLDLLVAMATNKMDILSGGDFQGDLLFRANAINPIVLPPLRERKEDIMMLAEFFTSKYEKILGAHSRTISADAQKLLISHKWPGNIRELENIIKKAVSDYKGLKVLSANHLSFGDKLNKEQLTAPTSQTQQTREVFAGSTEYKDLDSLIEILENFNFDYLHKEQLKGKLPEIRDAYARFVANYLAAVLKATLSYNSRSPEGEIAYHPAVKWMTNDFEMKATPAKRLLNNLLKISPESIKKILDSEPLLQKAVNLCGDDKLKTELERMGLIKKNRGT